MIKNLEQKLETFKETDHYKKDVCSSKFKLERIIEANEHIKQGSYIKGYAILKNIRGGFCCPVALSKLIDAILDDLMQVEESKTFVFVNYCKAEIERILNETDYKITSGYDLGMHISKNVQIPVGKNQQNQLTQAWAEELLEYLKFAYEEGNLEANPFREQSKFLKNAVSQATKIIIQLSNTAEVNWRYDGPKDLLDQKQTIINEINEIKRIKFEEIF